MRHPQLIYNGKMRRAMHTCVETLHGQKLRQPLVVMVFLTETPCTIHREPACRLSYFDVVSSQEGEIRTPFLAKTVIRLYSTSGKGTTMEITERRKTLLWTKCCPRSIPRHTSLPGYFPKE